MTKNIKDLTKEMQSEYVIGGVKNKTVMKKGVWCMTVKLLFSSHVVEIEYFIPVKPREIKIYQMMSIFQLTHKTLTEKVTHHAI